MSNTQRLQILNENEITEFYAIPKFNTTQRSHYFSLPENVLKSLKIKNMNFRHTSAKLYFILQYGYFKAKNQFFNIQYDHVKNDVLFIMEQYLPNDSIPKRLPTRKVQNAIKNKILEWMGFSDDMEKIDFLILEKASALARSTQNPMEIFEEIIKLLRSANMVLPKYSRLQDIIGAALKNEDQRLIQMVNTYLTKNIHKSLENLFQSEDAFYHITELKLDARSFQTNQMQAEIKKITLCKPIYDFSEIFLPKLSLSRRMIEHYSDLAKMYDVYRLQNIPKEIAYLYLICYVSIRYERLMNNLIQGFIYYVDKYYENSKDYAKEHLAELTDPLDKRQTAIGQLIGIFADKKIMSLHGNEIKKHAFDILPEESIISVRDILLDIDKYKENQERKLIWEYHKSNYQSILINLRPLFLIINFDGSDEIKKIFKSIKFLKKLFQKEKSLKDVPFSSIPTAHIKPNALINDFTETINGKGKKSKKVMNIYQYEFYLYRAIRENIRKSKVYINNSTGYKSFEAELNISPTWHKDKNEILKNLNNPVLMRPIDDILKELEDILESLLERTNKRAMNGENKHIKIIRHRDGRTEWTIPYPKRNIEIDNPFYDQLDIKMISEIYDFVEKQCGFMNAFTHIKPRGSMSKKDYLGIKAVILANGTAQGTYEFAKRSNLKYKRLQIAEQNHIRLSTLRNAADIIVDHMINLPIFDSYNLNDKKHGSSDGTKKKTKRRFLRARFSRKYFGDDVGMVIMTMILNHVPFVSRIIGANEHESHFIYPMLQANSSDIDPDIISTDTAGTNNVNDFLYYLIGKIHAPCYRSAAKKTKTICGFKSLSHYRDLLIKPTRQVKVKLIKDKWPELLPIYVSLLSHDTNQENIVRILSSHEYKSDVKEAFWELNHILKSIHHLKYVDDPQYRRDIRKSLNRGEAYHQLIEKILAVGNGSFRGMTDLEVEIWSECTRLIALIIIYYNMHLLSKLYEIALEKNDKTAMEYLKYISPVASQHINIAGLYEFSETPADINVDQVVDTLRRILEGVLAPTDVEEEEV